MNFMEKRSPGYYWGRVQDEGMDIDIRQYDTFSGQVVAITMRGKTDDTLILITVEDAERIADMIMQCCKAVKETK